MYTNEADVKVISRGTMIEDLILKNVTGGKNHESSLVFHFACNDENHEFHIKNHSGIIEVLLLLTNTNFQQMESKV